MADIKYTQEADGWTRIERNLDDTQKLIDICGELAKQHNNEPYSEKEKQGRTYRGKHVASNKRNNSSKNNNSKHGKNSPRKSKTRDRNESNVNGVNNNKKLYDIENEEYSHKTNETAAVPANTVDKKKTRENSDIKTENKPKYNFSKSKKKKIDKIKSDNNFIANNKECVAVNKEDPNKLANILGASLALILISLFGIALCFFGNKVAESVETGTLIMWMVDAVMWFYEIFYSIVSWIFEIVIDWFPM